MDEGNREVLAEFGRRAVEEYPPLTEEQVDRLSRLLGPLLRRRAPRD